MNLSVLVRLKSHKALKGFLDHLKKHNQNMKYKKQSIKVKFMKPKIEKSKL